MAVSPRGDVIAYHVRKERPPTLLKVCDGNSGKLLKVLDRQHMPDGLCFSGDGATLLTWSAGRSGEAIYFWDTQTWTVRRTIEKEDRVATLGVSPDGKRLAWGSWSRRGELYDLEHDKPLAHFERDEWTQYDAVRFSPDGKLLLVVAGDKVLVLDGHSGKRKGEIRPRGRSGNSISAFAVGPDSSRVVLGAGHNELEVWGLNPIRKLHDLKGHNLSLSSAAFSPRGDKLLTGTYGFLDERPMREYLNEVKLWDVATGKEVGHLHHKGFARSLAFLPDGERFVTGQIDDEGNVAIFRIRPANGSYLLRPDDRVDSDPPVAPSRAWLWWLSGGGAVVALAVLCLWWRSRVRRGNRRRNGPDGLLGPRGHRTT